MSLDVDPVTVTGAWQRHIPAGGDPLWRPAEPVDSRWQRGAVIDALYLADDDATMWAEWFRQLAEAGLPPGQNLPRDVWRFAVEATVADLSDARRLARVGLRRPRPARSSWPAFQAVGEQLAAEGWAGLAAPSAARPGGRVLCLFAPEGVVPEGARPVPPPISVGEVPPPPRGMRT